MLRGSFLFWVGIGLAAVALGLGVWWYQTPERPSEEKEPLSLLPPAPTQTPIQRGQDAEEGGSELEDVSLPVFAEKTFDGRDFTVGNVLAENEAYTRYYITYKSHSWPKGQSTGGLLFPEEPAPPVQSEQPAELQARNNSGELSISGIMNVPKGKGPFPVLFLNHGYIDPGIYTNGRGLKREQDYLARRGFIVIHSDYRNHADSGKDPDTDKSLRLGYAEDVINGIKAMQKSDLPYFDKDKIGMLGHSMGGGVAWVIATTQPGLVDAFVQFAPVSADARDNFEKWLGRRREVAEYLLSTYGSPQQNPGFWDNISPITFFRAVTVPILIHHGTADESVPLEWSKRATDALKAQKKEVTLYEYPGEPHEFIDAWPTVMQRTVEFFQKNLS